MNKSKVIIIVVSILCILTVVVAIILLGKGTIYDRYKCPDSTYKLENKRCTKIDVVDTYKKLVCKEGFDAKGDTCVKTDTVASKVSYTCSKGYTLDNKALTCNKKTVIDRIYVYKCISGSDKDPSDEKKCLKYAAPKTRQQGAETVKYCEQGTLVGNNCVYKVNAIKSRGCPDNYQKTSKNTCTRIESNPAIIKRSCNKVYNLDGIKCVKTTIEAGKYEETCKMGYELKGSKCYKNIDIVATKAGLF